MEYNESEQPEQPEQPQPGSAIFNALRGVARGAGDTAVSKEDVMGHGHGLDELERSDTNDMTSVTQEDIDGSDELSEMERTDIDDLLEVSPEDIMGRGIERKIKLTKAGRSYINHQPAPGTTLGGMR